MNYIEQLASFGHLQGSAPTFGGGDPYGTARFRSLSNTDLQSLRIGCVIIQHVGWNCCLVLIGAELCYCRFADELSTGVLGFKKSLPPQEGDFVIVIREKKDLSRGFIIGRLANEWDFQQGDQFDDPESYERLSCPSNSAIRREDVQSFVLPCENEFDSSAHNISDFRPTDVLPLDVVNLNAYQCGSKGSLFSYTVMGGGASIRLSALENRIREVCDAFQRHDCAIDVEDFHNGRYLSSERMAAVYQEERLGWFKPDEGTYESNVWSKDSNEAKTKHQTMRPRIKEFSGYFGNLISKFCLRPDPDDQDLRKLESQPKEAGVARESVDPSGQYRLSAAGMLTFERTGRIPIPVRTSFPWVRGHDLEQQPERLEEFKHDKEHPFYRQLELFDRLSYDLKNQYARVDGLGEDNPDHYVPQETDLKPLDDAYDEKFTGSRTVQLKKYDKRRCGAYMGEDGSLILRDAWGSEIVMIGGNVQISCAGNVMLMPGKTALTLAGDDIVQKARNSIDLHATNHDIRLSASCNLEMVGGADDSKSKGGVLIEARGKSSAAWDGTAEGASGEATRTGGIVLKASKAPVVLDGKNLNLRSRVKTSIISGDQKIDGSVVVSAKQFSAFADTISQMTRKAAIIVSSGIQAAAESVVVAGKSGLTLMNGSQAPALMWTDIGTNIAEVILDGTSKNVDQLSDEKKVSNGYPRESLEKMFFCFRTSQQCGTDRSWEIGGSDHFTLYEPAWIQVLQKFETLKNGKISSEVLKETADWTSYADGKSGLPWPGENAKDDAKYAQLQDLVPQNLTDEGFNLNRDKVSDKSNVVEVKLDGNYLVRTEN